MLAETPEPNACRPRAFRLFLSQLSRLETTDGLLLAAIALSLHALDDVEPHDVVARLDEMARRVRRRVRSTRLDAVLAHLHDELFDREGFRGDVDNYYSPLNSYLPAVLERRCGIPISLSLVYKVIAHRLGVRVTGINAPGHFLVQVIGDREPMFVDPFFGGRLLSREESFQCIETVTGATIPRSASILQPATHREWLTRMLQNLLRFFAASDCYEDHAAMTELRTLLERGN